MPVDTKPVMYEQEVEGKYIIYDKNHKKVPFARIYVKNSKPLEHPKQGHIPHYFTCSALREARREWYNTKHGGKL